MIIVPGTHPTLVPSQAMIAAVDRQLTGQSLGCEVGFEPPGHLFEEVGHVQVALFVGLGQGVLAGEVDLEGVGPLLSGW